MRTNYPYQKRAKELARKKKQEEKRQRRLDKKNAPPPENPKPVSNEGTAAQPGINW